MRLRVGHGPPVRRPRVRDPRLVAGRSGVRAWVVLAALGLAAVGGGPGAAAANPFEALGLVPFESGIRAPAVRLADLAGREVRVPPPSASATVLVFWATW